MCPDLAHYVDTGHAAPQPEASLSPDGACQDLEKPSLAVGEESQLASDNQTGGDPWPAFPGEP
jgi:hypothetical protein